VVLYCFIIFYLDFLYSHFVVVHFIITFFGTVDYYTVDANVFASCDSYIQSSTNCYNTDASLVDRPKRMHRFGINGEQ